MGGSALAAVRKAFRMEHIPTELQTVSQQFYAAVNEGVMYGDASAMLALWSERDDSSYCDPSGHVQLGRQALADYWNHAALLNSAEPGSISATTEILAVQASAEMVSMIVREHIQLREQRQIIRRQALATNVYRYEDQQWRMVHRHTSTPMEEE